MDRRISRFLRRHHVLTLSSVSDEGSWTAHVFYAYMPDHESLVFTTDPKTRHGREMLANPSVSGGIVLETKVVGRIRGVQLTGKTKRPETRDQRPETRDQRPETRDQRRETRDQRPETRDQRQETEEFVTRHSSLVTSCASRVTYHVSRITHHASRVTYLKRFPYAIAVKLDLWVLELDYVKMTDNRLGFGTKLEWRRETKDKETRDKRLETRDKRLETRDKRQETRDKRLETRDQR